MHFFFISSTHTKLARNSSILLLVSQPASSAFLRTSFPLCKAFASGADNLLANPIVFFVVAFAAFFLADSAFLSAALCSLVNFWASLFSSASICFSVFLLSPFVPVQDWKQVIEQCTVTICYLKYLKVSYEAAHGDAFQKIKKYDTHIYKWLIEPHYLFCGSTF